MRNLTRQLIATASLVVLAPLAVYASSYRYLDVYLPAQPSQQLAADGDVVHYRSETIVAGKTLQREIDVRFIGAKTAPQWNGLGPVAGAEMWVFEFEFGAEPSVYAEGCELRVLDAQGRKYRMRAATEVLPDMGEVNYHPCVPLDAPGPTLEFGSEKLVDSPLPRPKTWRVELGVSMPQGVRPAAVQLVWDPPQYAQFSVPN